VGENGRTSHYRGKAVSTMNALKHGMRSAENRERKRLIAAYGRLEGVIRNQS
jgi:hypothetical protein